MSAADALPGGIPEVLRAKRDGERLPDATIDAFVRAVADDTVSDSQIAAFTMAVCLRGMNAGECAALTRAMADSGDRLDWSAADLAGPVLDKHSTGGVGDKVSLLLAPALAACGAFVPMLSGRGLGHTGGTLDKLEAIPGFSTDLAGKPLLGVMRDAGCAIVGASSTLAPADRRMYAVRDVTATVESVPLITASILSKKLAAGVSHLVMDVKQGSGAFTPEPARARALAHNLVNVGTAAGLPTEAIITDMDEVLGTTAGNALEVAEVAAALRGDRCDPRLFEVVVALGASLLVASELADDMDAAQRQLATAFAEGAVAERFDRMVVAQGGPVDFLDNCALHLPSAPAVLEVPAPADGYLAAIDTRAVGLAVVQLGGGRQAPGDRVDPGVGFDAVASVGSSLEAGQPVARVHAASDSAARAGAEAYLHACSFSEEPVDARPAVLEYVE